MRLCLLTPGFSAAEDDWCIPALHHLVCRLAADHQVTVLALRHPSRRDSYGFFGARVLPFAAGARTGWWRVVMFARVLAALRREHQRSAVDLFHGLWADEAGFLAVLAGSSLGVRSVVSVMGGELAALPEIGYGVQLGRTGRWLVGRSVARASAVTVGSPGLLEAVAPFRHSRPGAVVAPLGIDTTLFCPHGELANLEGDPCLIQVGSLVPVKDQNLLLETFARIAASHSGGRLHLVGEGPLREALGARVGDLGLGGRVRFHGQIPHDRLPSFYRRADLHLQSSRFESQGMAVLEAAACGTSTVGTAVGILPDLARDGAAVAVAPRDAEALASAVLAVLDSPDRTRVLGNTANARVAADFTLDQAVERLVAIYASASSQRSPGG